MDEVARPRQNGAPPALGARLVEDGAEFSVWSRHGERGFVCLFDESGERETARWRLGGRDDDIHHGFVPGVRAGARYGLRFEGPDDPARGHRFDPSKLLIDPYATRIDAPVRWRRELAAPRSAGIDTAPFMPRAIIEAPWTRVARMPKAAPPTFIYEVAVKAFTMRHPDTPTELRGTIAGLAGPRLIEHLVKLGVSHVELMPLTACMSERHLAERELENAWFYNPALFTALDPRLAPGGFDDLRMTVDALHAAGISVLLDVVFNHTAEGDDIGPTLNLRGLDNSVYYRHTGAPARLVNDTGCGNTLACDRAPVVRLIVDSLRTFVERAGVDGFRFDLAATLVRDDGGFPQSHPLLTAIAADPVLKHCTMIAEPWDIGPGGYRLGAFPPNWLEWNDRYRDSTRRFWRGDQGAIGDFATRFAGSADVFGATRDAPTASVNFIAAHDGFALRDLVSYERKHNDANGENSHDGTDDNLSWNCGIEGVSDDANINATRLRDIRALLANLFVSRGTPMLTAGDEMGRTQGGNNNAYAQDNATTWLDWAAADRGLADYVGALAQLRRMLAPLHADRFLTGRPREGETEPDVAWMTPAGAAPDAGFWENGDLLCATFFKRASDTDAERVFIVFNRSWRDAPCVTPPNRLAHEWRLVLDSARGCVDVDSKVAAATSGEINCPARCVLVHREFAVTR